MNLMKSFPSAIGRTLLGFALPLVLCGCVAPPVAPESSSTHPGNPNSAISAVPPFEPGLLTLTNVVMIKAATNPVPEHQHGTTQDETKPPEKK